MVNLRLLQGALLLALAGLLFACPVVFFTEGQAEKAFAACFSRDGRFIARSVDYPSGRQRLAVFDVQTGESWALADCGNVAFSPDGALLACGGNEQLTIWNWRERRQLHSWSGNNRWAFHVAVSPSGAMVAGADDNSLRVWDLNTGVLGLTIPLAYEHHSLAFSADSKFIITAGTETKADGDRTHEIKLWTVADGKLHSILTGPEYCIVRSLAVSPDGEKLATGLSINSVRLWDIQSGKELWKVDEVPANYGTLAFTSDGLWLAAGGFDGVTMLDTARPENRKFSAIPSGSIEAVLEGNVPGHFVVGAGTQVYDIDAASGIVSLVCNGLTVRNHLPFWSVVLGLPLWAGLWTLTYRRIAKHQQDKPDSAERCVWLVVLATACITAAHWGLLLLLAVENWLTANPIGVLNFMSMSWLPLIAVVLVSWIFYFKRPMAFAACAFCLLAMAAQMFFELYLWAAVIASV